MADVAVFHFADLRAQLDRPGRFVGNFELHRDDGGHALLHQALRGASERIITCTTRAFAGVQQDGGDASIGQHVLAVCAGGETHIHRPSELADSVHAAGQPQVVDNFFALAIDFASDLVGEAVAQGKAHRHIVGGGR